MPTRHVGRSVWAGTRALGTELTIPWDRRRLAGVWVVGRGARAGTHLLETRSTMPWDRRRLAVAWVVGKDA